jgi:hypothetical protein
VKLRERESVLNSDVKVEKSCKGQRGKGKGIMYDD